MRNVVGQELQGDEAEQICVLGLVDNAHLTAAELFNGAVVRDNLVDYGRGRSLGALFKDVKKISQQRTKEVAPHARAPVIS